MGSRHVRSSSDCVAKLGRSVGAGMDRHRCAVPMARSDCASTWWTRRSSAAGSSS